ncbi:MULTISPECIES: tetratricopeptide repeat protein [unclassified Agarivorans]|uniref:tetratricopeptide repeat protein n=1 Tax=unclassified Agarivorans TaxID=2636026 RepID=UPI003D7CE2BF
MKTTLTLSGLLVSSLFASSASFAANDNLPQIQSDWAHCQYQVEPNKAQVQCFEQLIELNYQAVNNDPKDLELQVWLAINKASLAGAKGGLSALRLAKEAKQLLEQVIDKNPKTLDGSAYTSLGSLYYKVPGWPIGFGDDDKAEAMLKQALALNPDGIDPNYFYGDFLAEDGRKQQAIEYLTRAQQAAARPDRPLADKGRQQQIALRLESLK